MVKNTTIKKGSVENRILKLNDITPIININPNNKPKQRIPA